MNFIYPVLQRTGFFALFKGCLCGPRRVRRKCRSPAVCVRPKYIAAACGVNVPYAALGPAPRLPFTARGKIVAILHAVGRRSRGPEKASAFPSVAVGRFGLMPSGDAQRLCRWGACSFCGNVKRESGTREAKEKMKKEVRSSAFRALRVRAAQKRETAFFPPPCP